MPKILPNIRQTILEQGRLILIENGYDNMNIRDVAKNCNIGIGTFYNYFSNKEDLVIEIITRDWDKILQSSESLISEKINLKDKLFIVYDLINNFLNKYLSIFMSMMSDNIPACPRDKIMNPIYENTEKILQVSKDRNEINPDIPLIKLSRILIGSMVFLSKEKDIDFEEFYSLLNL